MTEEIFVGIDADTIIAPDAIRRMVPHFVDPKIGALAGNAKVGNKINLWTRWQALEYITSQNFERRALNTFSAVSVVPGAIGAWRTQAVKQCGGYHVDTVAEDADLTMALLQAGYKVEYEDRALAFTEAPSSAHGLMRQRFRWSFGILQATWKHRSAFARKGALGWMALPNIVVFQIAAAIVLAVYRSHVCRGFAQVPGVGQAFSSGYRGPGEFPATGVVFCDFPGDRFHRFHDCFRSGTARRAGAIGCCWVTCGSSVSPIASYSPWC